MSILALSPVNNHTLGSPQHVSSIKSNILPVAREIFFPSSNENQESALKTLITVFRGLQLDLNFRWGPAQSRRSLGLELIHMPIPLGQFMIEQGLNVNDVVPVTAPNGREIFTATPLSDALAVGYSNNGKSWELTKRIAALVHLLIFNGAVLKPEGRQMHERYEANVKHMGEFQGLLGQICRICAVKGNLKVKVELYWTNLWKTILRSQVMCKIFNACLDRKLAIPSPMPGIVENLFRHHCEIDPLHIKDIYGIIGDYVGSKGLSRSYLSLHYSEHELLQGIVTHYGKNEKLPNGKTNLSSHEGESILIEELVEADIVNSNCVNN